MANNYKSTAVKKVLKQLDFKYEILTSDLTIGRDLGNGLEIRIKSNWGAEKEYFLYVWNDKQLIDFRYIESLERLKTACDGLYNQYRLYLVS
jgi:hypothetical protein